MKRRIFFLICITLLLFFHISLSFASKEKIKVLIDQKQKGNKILSSQWIVKEISKKEIKTLKKQGYKVYKLGYKKIFLTESVPLIKANYVWKIILNGKNITGKDISVCVVDTGVNYSHPDLGGCFGAGCKVIAGYDFVNGDSDPMDDNGHGTHVAGIIAANGTLKGVAPDAKIVAVKVCDAAGYCFDEDVLNGIEWCINHSSEYNISVISISLGGGAYANYCDQDEWPYAELIDKAVSKGISVVIATGNEGNYTGIASPACVYNATRVGAVYDNYYSSKTWCLEYELRVCIRSCTDSNINPDNITCFTNRGEGFDYIFFAPGAMINSTVLNGYEEYAGTSMAAPHVSGAIALIRQVNKNLSPKEIEELLNKTAKQIYDSNTSKYYPRIDVYNAISKLIIPKLSLPMVSPQIGNTSTIFNFTVNYSHAANVSPVYVKVCIDDSCFNASSSDNNYQDGVVFYYSTNLNYGLHKFYFEVYDGEYKVNTSIIHFPWVADKFWLDKNQTVTYENLTEKYIITNSSLLNITEKLILKNSFVKNLNNLNIYVHGNASLENTFFEAKPVLKIFVLSEANITWNLSEGEIKSLKVNISVINFSTNKIFITIKNTMANITNSKISSLILENSSIIGENTSIFSLDIVENSSVKGYFSLGNITIHSGKILKRYFPIELVKDINKTHVDRNLTLWKDKAIANFTTQNGFVWISANFSEQNENYYLFIENYGFAKINETTLAFFVGLNTTENITLDVVIPQVSVNVSNLFVSPLTSQGIKDNTTIELNASEPLLSSCIFINSSFTKIYEACGKKFVWPSTGQNVSDGIYSLWINLSDFWSNKNITKITEIIVDNTYPNIKLDIPKVVINGTKINITINITEANLNVSFVNITSHHETFSKTFYNFTQFDFIPNYTDNYTIIVESFDKAGNKCEKEFSLISRPKVELNFTIFAPFLPKIFFIYENSITNQTNLLENTTVFSLPEWIFNISIILNNSLEVELGNVNITENKNISLKIEKAQVENFLKTFVFEAKVNFSFALVKLNYSDTNYTNEDFLAIYVCNAWNFTNAKCDSSWIKTNFTINKTSKIIETITQHFSAFAIKQEPYCGDSIVNQVSEECDNNDFSGKTCQSFGYDYGQLLCTANCKIDFSNCKFYSVSSSTQTSYSGGAKFVESVQKVKEEKPEIINISLKCPENITSSSRNVSFRISVSNHGNSNVSVNIFVKPISFNETISLLAEETKELNIKTFFEEGLHKVTVLVQNNSCRFYVNISLPRIYHELKEKIEILKILARELNVSSYELEKANELLEKEKYSQASLLIKEFENKLNEKLKNISKIQKKKISGKEYEKFLRQVFILLLAIPATLIVLRLLKKYFNFFSRS